MAPLVRRCVVCRDSTLPSVESLESRQFLSTSSPALAEQVPPVSADREEESAVSAQKADDDASAVAVRSDGDSDVQDNVEQTGNHTDDEESGDREGDQTGEHVGERSGEEPGGNTGVGAPAGGAPAGNPLGSGQTGGGQSNSGTSSGAASGDDLPSQSRQATPIQPPSPNQPADGSANAPDGRLDTPNPATPERPGTDDEAPDGSQDPVVYVNPDRPTSLTAHPAVGLSESPEAESAPAKGTPAESVETTGAAAQTQASPFGDSAVRAPLPLVITSDSSAGELPGTFSVVEVADAAAQAVTASMPALAAGAERLTKAMIDGGAVPGAAVQLAYHFARVNASATFSDALGRFINECASLAPAIVPDNTTPLRKRAWLVTIAVAAVDLALGAYALRRGWIGRRQVVAVR